MRSTLVVAIALVTACDPGIQLGTPCEYSSQCTAPLVCGFGRCRAECLRNRDCSLGALCLLDQDGHGTCALADDPDCRDPGESCATGLACFAGDCVNACDTVAECPPDSVCVPAPDGRARCVPEDRAPDAGAPDAGAIDAATDGGSSACTGTACVRAITAGGLSTCALTEGGAIWCWGAVVLGDATTHPTCNGDLACSATPVQVMLDDGGAPAPIQGATALASGNSSACAILEGGSVACWGAGWIGQLGAGSEDGAAAHRVHGVDGVGLLDHVIALHPGNELWVAERDVDPRVVGWGERASATFLDGGGAGGVWEPIAVAVPAFDELVVGGWHACVHGASGVSCWGRNIEGEAGGATTGTDAFVLAPSAVAGTDGIARLVAGARGTCALRGDDVVCWGSQFFLAGGTTMADCYCSRSGVVIDRAFDARYRALFSSPSADSFFALDDTGRAWCWGYNANGGACHPDARYSVDAPFARPGLPTPIDAIAVGYEHACALVAGEVWCWGSNRYGQIAQPLATAVATDPASVALAP